MQPNNTLQSVQSNLHCARFNKKYIGVGAINNTLQLVQPKLHSVGATNNILQSVQSKLHCRKCNPPNITLDVNILKIIRSSNLYHNDCNAEKKIMFTAVQNNLRQEQKKHFSKGIFEITCHKRKKNAVNYKLQPKAGR